MNFHEDKLWQSAYVALMDLYDACEGVSGTVIDQMLASGVGVVAKIAESLTRRDSDILLSDAAGLVAVTRSHLAVAWGKKFLDDETFRALDGKYAKLTENLQ